MNNEGKRHNGSMSQAKDSIGEGFSNFLRGETSEEIQLRKEVLGEYLRGEMMQSKLLNGTTKRKRKRLKRAVKVFERYVQSQRENDAYNTAFIEVKEVRNEILASLNSHPNPLVGRETVSIMLETAIPLFRKEVRRANNQALVRKVRSIFSR